jgi:membrane protein
VSRIRTVIKRAVVAFYRDQATHHAAALTYYALMSLFPVLLLAVSLLGLFGEYPATYNAIVGHLRSVVPTVTLAPLSAAVKAALKSRGTAAAALIGGAATAVYGGTGYLEAARRALNVVFGARDGRSFVRRKLTDAGSLLVLLALVLVTVVLIFAGGSLARRVLGSEPAELWRVVRWPAAFISALLVFSFIYYVTPDVRRHAFRQVMPGALVGVSLWLIVSAGFSEYLAHFDSFNVTYGSFAAAIILLVWLWLTNLTLLFGAEISAEVEREHQPAAVAAEAVAGAPPPADAAPPADRSPSLS